MTRQTRLFLELFVLLAIAIIAVWLQQTSTSSAVSFKSAKKKDALHKDIESAGELVVHKKGQASPGLTLFPEVGSARVVLLDISGKPVHEWKVDATRARLLPGCNLLVVHGSKWGMKQQPWQGLRKTVREYDPEGQTVWEYTSSTVAHHDISRLSNGNTLFPIRVLAPEDAKQVIEDPVRKMIKIRSDSILEVSAQGKIVWRWDAHQHLDINSCGRKGCREFEGRVDVDKALSDWTHINTVTVIPENHWYDQGDDRFKPGNLMILPRNWWMAMIIDRSSGKVVWEYGGDYKGGLSGGHEAHMIEPGLPGAGNILIFDNGRQADRRSSVILEIDPSTKELVWKYEAGSDFYSRSAGSVQRLPNGNTLIAEDNTGRAFEVNTAGEIVWEFKGRLPSSRTQRYPLSYCEGVL